METKFNLSTFFFSELNKMFPISMHLQYCDIHIWWVRERVRVQYKNAAYRFIAKIVFSITSFTFKRNTFCCCCTFCSKCELEMQHLHWLKWQNFTQMKIEILHTNIYVSHNSMHNNFAYQFFTRFANTNLKNMKNKS